jgi:hypothetical protein
VLKRFIISLFVLLGYVLFQAHNFIPHLHADRVEASHSHQHDQQHHHNHDADDEKTGDHDEKPIDIAGHDAQFGTTIIKRLGNTSIAQQSLNSAVLIPLIISFLHPDNISPPPLFPIQASCAPISLHHY